MSEEQDDLMNTSALARHFNLSRPTVITRLKENNCEPEREDRTGKYYSLAKVGPYMRSEYAGKTDKKTQAQERKLVAEAREKEIKVERLEGSLVPIADVERALVDVLRTLYQLLVVQFSAKYATDIARLQTRGEVEHFLKEKIGGVFQEVRSNPTNLLTKRISEW